MAPGTEATHRALTDVRRRPPEPRDAIPDMILESEPVLPLDGQGDVLAESEDSTEGGPSGMRNEQMRPLLDNDADNVLQHIVGRRRGSGP